MKKQQTVQVPARTPRVDGVQGLTAQFTSNGSVARLEAFGHSLLLYPARELEAGPANLHLRVLDGENATWTPLLGPRSGGVVESGEDHVRVHGSWNGLDWAVTFRPGAPSDADSVLPETDTAHASWRWDVEVENTGSREVVVDVVLSHDPALASPGAVATNEYYVAQYLDVSPLDTARGTALAVRQNMPGTSVPWLVLGSLRRGTGWATDALQVVERTRTGTVWSALDRAALPSTRVQHEHTLVVLQDEPASLAPGATHRTGFVGLVLADHPDATGPQDARWLEVAEAETSSAIAAAPSGSSAPAVPTLLDGSPGVEARPLSLEELAVLDLAAHADVETAPDGEPWAWSTGEHHHVVTAAKELAVLRPHGHLLRTGSTLTPDDECLTTTVWMDGTFSSQVTRGHVGRDPLLTGRRSYLGLHRAHGVRILLDTDEGPRLLGTPSAWRVGLDGCSWFYAVDDLVLEVSTHTPPERHEITLAVRVRAGRPRSFLVALATAGEQEVAVDGAAVTVGGPKGWRLAWRGADTTVGDDGALHADGLSRDPSWVTLAVDPTRSWVLRTTAAGTAADPSQDDAAFWDGAARSISLSAADAPADRAQLLAPISSALPWFAHDALVHYLSPRGLEQYTGGGWGTRDVCQGPVGLLTALDRQDVVRDLLGRVFRAQNARGDWPQAFEFHAPLPESGQHGSHGDVVFWPLLATGEHLLASGEPDVLDVVVPLVDDDGLTEPLRVAEHLGRALDRIEESTVAGSPLPAYGHGDWNDSLQPADPHLASNLVSVWTSVLQTQALRTLAAGLRAVGAEPELGERAAALADATEDAIHHELLTDDVLPGYVLHHDDGTREPLVHPRDERTGLTLGILPWVHAVSADLLTSEQAEHHLALVEEHLLGPDGARLFDRPVAYAGGPMTVFQRAEASTFWGREIGLMYVHAHLRYAEALARVGRGAQLLRALAIATPRGAVDVVRPARARQSTTYFSSSDGAFTDRYDAQERYPALMAAEVPIEGGWRVYSSGPGLFLRLVVEVLLGVRRRGQEVELDPVLDPALGELRATVPFDGGTLDVLVRPGRAGHGVTRVTARGTELHGTALDNPYRHGGVRVRLADLRRAVAGRTAGDDTADLIVETR